MYTYMQLTSTGNIFGCIIPTSWTSYSFLFKNEEIFCPRVTDPSLTSTKTIAPIYLSYQESKIKDRNGAL